MEIYLHPKLDDEQLCSLSSLALAHVGDAVYELMVRTYLSTHGAYSSKALHRATIQCVSAIAQAKAADILVSELTEEERVIYKRGRNANPRTIPKSCTREEYGKATAVETLFGTLFLQGKEARLESLFRIIINTL